MPNRRNMGRQPLSIRLRVLSNSNQEPSNDAMVGTAPSQDRMRQTSSENLNLTEVASQDPALPLLPAMNGLAFETFFLCYAVMALFSQQLYIYKTVWWYPNTLPPSTTAVNFHLIDKNLTALIVLLFSRRFLWLLLSHHMKPSGNNTALNVVWLLFCVGGIGFFIMEMIKNVLALLAEVTWYKLMFLLSYPLMLWLPLNGFCIGCVRCATGCITGRGSCSKHQSNVLLKCSWDKSVEYRNTIFEEVSNSLKPEQIRNKVKLLCSDVNSRLTEIIFGSVICSYYAGLIPMFFTKVQHSYDIPWSLQHTTLTFVNSFVMLASHLLPPDYIQILHKSAKLLGGYQLVRKGYHCNMMNGDTVKPWSPDDTYLEATKIKFEDSLYIAVGKQNVAHPTNGSHFRFFFMFSNPLRTLNWLLGLHFAVVVFQIYVLIWSSSWERLVMPAVLQFFSYYILYSTLRDRIALGKIYFQHDSLQC